MSVYKELTDTPRVRHEGFWISFPVCICCRNPYMYIRRSVRWVISTWNNATVTLPYIYIATVPALKKTDNSEKHRLKTHTSTHIMARSISIFNFSYTLKLIWLMISNLSSSGKNIYLTYYLKLFYLLAHISDLSVNFNLTAERLNFSKFWLNLWTLTHLSIDLLSPNFNFSKCWHIL